MFFPAFDSTEVHETKIGFTKSLESSITRLQAMPNISQRVADNLEGGALDPADYVCAQICPLSRALPV